MIYVFYCRVEIVFSSDNSLNFGNFMIFVEFKNLASKTTATAPNNGNQPTTDPITTAYMSSTVIMTSSAMELTSAEASTTTSEITTQHPTTEIRTTSATTDMFNGVPEG